MAGSSGGHIGRIVPEWWGCLILFFYLRLSTTHIIFAVQATALGQVTAWYGYTQPFCLIIVPI